VVTQTQAQVLTPRSIAGSGEAATRATAEDKTVTFMPFFAIRDAEKFFEVCNICLEKVKTESLCLGYGFSVSAGPQQNMAFCREAFLNAEGVLRHLKNVGDIFKEGLCKYADLTSLQIHGPKDELDKLRRDPQIQELAPEFYELMPGSFEVIELPLHHFQEVQPVRAETGSLTQAAATKIQVSQRQQASQSAVNITTMPTVYAAPPGGHTRS